MEQLTVLKRMGKSKTKVNKPKKIKSKKLREMHYLTCEDNGKCSAGHY